MSIYIYIYYTCTSFFTSFSSPSSFLAANNASCIPPSCNPPSFNPSPVSFLSSFSPSFLPSFLAVTPCSLCPSTFVSICTFVLVKQVNCVRHLLLLMLERLHLLSRLGRVAYGGGPLFVWLFGLDE